MRIIYSDRARDLDHIDTWGEFPNLTGVTIDPLHRCLEIEACSGRKKTSLSSALRKIHMEFPPPPPPKHLPRGRSATPPGHLDITAGRQRRTIYVSGIPDGEIRIAEQVTRAPRRCRKALQIPEDDAYFRRPSESRAEYVSLLTDPLRSPEYASQMTRRYKGTTVETILRRATIPGNIEYLPTGRASSHKSCQS